MQTANIRRSIIRLAGIVALMTGLLMSSGIAAATSLEVGLAECSHDGCAVVTMSELRANRGIQAVPKQYKSFPRGPFDPQFVP